MANIEEHLRKAIEQGKFDDLPGKGQPLKLEENPLADEDWRLAYHMLKSAGYTLPWIEQLHEIDLEIASARHTLRRAWEWREAALTDSHSYPPAVEAEWQRLVNSFAQQVEKINQRINDLNLQVPSDKFQRLKLNPDKEIEKATSGI